MKLILFRHGLAMEREEAFAKKLDDSLRPLVEKGKQKTERMAKLLAEQVPSVDLIVSSPLLRAQQTAHLVQRHIECESFRESAELVPEAPPQAFARWVRSEAGQASSILVVGHEPQLSTFASWTLSGAQESFIDLKKSGLLMLDVESLDSIGPSCAMLKWALSPKLIG